MKTKNLRLPVLFASAGAIICTVSVARAADASLEVRQDQSTTQKEVINEPSGADRSYTIQSSQPAVQSSYSSRTYESGAQLDPDAEGDRVMHMYQRGKAAAESLDLQIKPNPIVVLPGSASFENFQTSESFSPGRVQQQSYGFNEPAAAERESTTSSSTTHRYSTTDNAAASTSSSSTATLSSGTTIKGSDLMGMNIRNEQGEKIGEVKDVVLDLKSGRVAYTVVSAGGIAGIGDKWLAVPPTVFTRTGTDRALTWNIEKEKLQTAPTIDKRNWNAALQQEYIGTVYNFYGVQGYNQDSDLNEPAGSQKKHDSQFDSEKQEKQDQDKKDQSRNDSSSSDLQGQSAGASTQSSEQSEALKSQPEKSASSSADISKEAAGAQSSSSSSSSAQPQSSSSSSSAQPESSASSSADVNAPAGAASSSSSASPSKTYTTDAQGQQSSSSSSQSSVSEPAGAATSSTEPSSDTASGSLVSKVQMALKNDASLSGSAQDVRFAMQEDKLVIKGTVKSQDEKNRILEKVKASAGSTQIDDQLKVSASSDSDSNSSSESSPDNK
ncbi:MAG: PRC-barrel domain protein [Verrucomicrobiales bacterium]|nr:PRC-barrel domain protein [Verrucomicrobiales bacterium]